MCYFKEKSAYILFIFLLLTLFIARPQFVYSQFDFDIDPPYIVQTSPEDGQIDVPITSSIEALFNEFMDTDNPFTINPFSINPYIDGQITWELDQTLIFSPAMLLGYNETYQVTIDTQATDLSGNPLETSYQWSFVTEPSPWFHFYDIQGLSLDQNNVKLILGEANGDIWAVLSSEGTSDDLFVFNGFDPSDFYKFDESFGQINAIDQDSAGNIWVASESDNPSEGGVHVYDGDWNHYNTNTNPIFLDNTIKCLTIDSADNVWAGSSVSGIYRFDGSSWTNYNMTDNGLSHDWVTNIKAGENDYIWIGTPFGGIEGFDRQTNTWTSYTSAIETQFNISFPLVSEIVSGSGNIWVATNLGVLKYDIPSDQWELFIQIGEYLLESQLNSIALDSSNILWVGTDEGLIAFDGVTGEPIVLDNVGPEVLEIAVDVYGNKWIGTSNSLSRYDTVSPLLLSFSPSDNKKNVSRNTKIVLTFSEPVNKNSVIDALSISPSISFTSSMNSSSTKLTIKPKSKLKDNKKYTVTVGKAATDIQGHPLTKSYSSSFKTEKKTTTTGTFPSTGFGTFPSFPSTGFRTFPSFPSAGFRTFPSFPSAGFRTFPSFPSAGFGTFPSFPSAGFRTFPSFPSTGFGTFGTYSSSPFRSIGPLVYPR
jgi:frataxin-like iron-binding protein CyaY